MCWVPQKYFIGDQRMAIYVYVHFFRKIFISHMPSSFWIEKGLLYYFIYYLNHNPSAFLDSWLFWNQITTKYVCFIILYIFYCLYWISLLINILSDIILFWWLKIVVYYISWNYLPCWVIALDDQFFVTPLVVH
jgi:hypothetical protein